LRIEKQGANIRKKGIYFLDLKDSNQFCSFIPVNGGILRKTRIFAFQALLSNAQ